MKKVEEDPHYDKKKAEHLLKSFVELHPHAIGEKVKICVEHFAAKVQGEIGGRAKAMIVTRSRLHAVRYKLAVDKYIAERGYPWKALVAFSGTVADGGKDYTESKMNSEGEPVTIGESQTAKTFERSGYRFLIVANKFQTGFDQPLLHTMYVDKKLGGVNAVQTLSRLNRTLAPEKTGTMVLDFANEADEIQAAFEPYFETTLLSEATDPNPLYERQTGLAAFPVYPRPRWTPSPRPASTGRCPRTGSMPFSPRSSIGSERSRIIAELNERFGLNLGPEHRVTLGQMMEMLDDDAALDAAARVNTRENVRLTFHQKVENVIQEIVDSNFDLYKRITDDRVFGEVVKPAEPGAGVPQVEGSGNQPGGGFLRAEWARHGETSPGQREGIHSDPVLLKAEPFVAPACSDIA